MIGWILSIFCIIGTVLNCFKVKTCFVIWAFCNIGWFVFDIYTAQYGRSVLDTVQFVTAIMGYVIWSAQEHK